MELMFMLLVLFQLKHYICDYMLQNTYMLNKFNRKGWIAPLATHAGVHAIGTALIAYSFLSFWYLLAVVLFDFIVHFIVDRLKAHPDIGGKFKPDQPQFWWALGADQSMHHLTHYIIIYVIWSLS